MHGTWVYHCFCILVSPCKQFLHCLFSTKPILFSNLFLKEGCSADICRVSSADAAYLLIPLGKFLSWTTRSGWVQHILTQV